VGLKPDNGLRPETGREPNDGPRNPDEQADRRAGRQPRTDTRHGLNHQTPQEYVGIRNGPQLEARTGTERHATRQAKQGDDASPEDTLEPTLEWAHPHVTAGSTSRTGNGPQLETKTGTERHTTRHRRTGRRSKPERHPRTDARVGSSARHGGEHVADRQRVAARETGWSRVVGNEVGRAGDGVCRRHRRARRGSSGTGSGGCCAAEVG
jgi:hypothetical protein